MANQVTARLKGDDYQHLLSWWHVLTLKMPNKKVREVRVEDDAAGSADDVTVFHEDGTDHPNIYCQIKYHVDHRQQYSTDVLLDATKGTSLLDKLWRTWKKLAEGDPTRRIELHLISNWTWDATDQVGACIDGDINALTDNFFSASPRSDVGKLRERWCAAVGATPDEFEPFARTLRFRLGFNNTGEARDRVVERMQLQKLRCDENALLIAVGVVREWVKSLQKVITREVLDEALARLGLFQPDDDEPSVTVYLSTIKKQKFELEPDYHLDWLGYFQELPGKRGHQLIDPANWDRVLLPELHALEKRISTEVGCRLIRARGLARLSAWFAFGYVFPEVGRYVIEVDQQGKLWRTDAKPSSDFAVTVLSGNGLPDGETIDGAGPTVAVGISVSGPLDGDVRAYLDKRTEQVAALLLLRPERELGIGCIRDAGDVVALAEGVKNAVRTFVKRWGATRLLLFYYGPLSGACFIGHRLNAVCREIQIMEDQQPGYAPSFLLE